MIDSIRKSLGIESMDDVTLLVETFYEFGPQKREREAKEEEERKAAKEDQQSNPELGNTKGKDDKGKKGKDAKQPAQTEPPTIEDEDPEEKDPMQPDFNLDDVVEVLEDFNNRREERLNNQDMVANPALKKKQNFQTEEQKAER
tara:strand:+ start:193 stop:624 length:432 start_codon:yes stop_codon:yes gene_type:complete